MSKNDDSIIFGMGLLAGILGGVALGIIFAPKSGEETRAELKQTIDDFTQNAVPEIKEAKKQALESLDMMKYRLERQYNKINDHIRAKQLAKAREKEDMSYGLN